LPENGEPINDQHLIDSSKFWALMKYESAFEAALHFDNTDPFCIIEDENPGTIPS